MNGMKEPNVWQELVHLARVALLDDRKQTQAFVRRLSRSLRSLEPGVAEALQELLTPAGAVTKAADSTRGAGSQLVPVDHESRFDLLRIEYPPLQASAPLLSPALAGTIEQILVERERMAELLDANLEPSRTILFTGPPGVGKTLTAHWIAYRLGKPLFTLDLASVMSSLLGRTGANLRAVLDYAKEQDGVLLLDEFDAVAKRRNDDTEIGELKRLVTVLLQEIDLWPSDRLLIAATNHGDLLDPAIWRRFDVVADFPLPTKDSLRDVLDQELGPHVQQGYVAALAAVSSGQSYSDVVRLVRGARRNALLSGETLQGKIVAIVESSIGSLPKAQVKAVARDLALAGLSQRQISDITGLSRDTIRRAQSSDEDVDG